MPGDGRRLSTWLSWGIPVLAILLFLGWLGWPLTGRLEAGPADRAGDGAAANGLPRQSEKVPVGTARVERRSLAVLAEATGRLEAWRQAELSVEVGGRVKSREVEPGQRVAAHATLMALEPIDRELELAEANADLLRVQANYALMVASDQKKDPTLEIPVERLEPQAYEEAKKRFAEGLISRTELDRVRRLADSASLLSGERQDEVRAVNIGLLQAEQRLERARLQLQRTRLEAPFAGRVADIAVEVGQQLAPGQRCLTLLDDRRLLVAVDVLERDLLRLRPGAAAKVRIPALDDRLLSGTVHAINPRVDPASGTGKVQVVVDNPEGDLLPGVFAFVQLETGRRAEQPVVPAAAVLVRQGRELVFRIEDGRALWTWVETGGRADGWVEIRSGLSAGDKVAVAGHFALAHETAVVETQAAAGPAPAPAPEEAP